MEKSHKLDTSKVRYWLKCAWEVLLYFWQLPQNILGSLLAPFRHDDDYFWYKGKIVCVDDRFVSNVPGDTSHNGVSLGIFIILEKYSEEVLYHEYGHCIQSMILGPLYLPVIGISSGAHRLIHEYREKRGLKVKPYRAFWTEKLADWLSKKLR